MIAQSTAGKMHTMLPAATRPLAKLEHFEISRDRAKLHAIQSLFSGRPDMAVQPGKYVRLATRDQPTDDWTLMMSDTPFELRSAYGFMGAATGDVLILGLGLGATTVPVLHKPNVTSVTIVEKNPDVIAMVAPALREHLPHRIHRKMRVVEADAFTWKPSKGESFDTMWFDIWPEISEDNLPDMTALKRRLTRYRKPGARPILCWEEAYLRRQAAQSRREDRYIYGAVGGRM